MLENLLATGSALAPFFVYLLLGMFLKRAGVIDDELAAAINSLIFKVFLPVNFFKSIYTADLSGLFGAAAVPYVMIATLIIMFALMKISKKLTDDPA
ncbi:MAG: AEC family transporter, partial [Firmicutes bacterium]|nr:AEC family transporter [Bacillota bacterium]